MMPDQVFTAGYQGVPNHVRLIGETDVERGRDSSRGGSILRGMTFEKKTGRQPDQSASFVPGTRTLLGHVNGCGLARFEAVCQSVNAPQQMRRDGKRLDPSKPPYRCEKWTEDVQRG